MTITTEATLDSSRIDPDPSAQCEAFVERVVQSVGGLFDIFSIYLGHRLGLYRILATHEQLTAPALARFAGINARYAREWLEQQTVTGILEVIDETADDEEREFRLPAGHAEALADPDSANFIAPVAQLAAAVVEPFEDLVNAFRTGEGVPYSRYGREMREGQAGMNKALCLNVLGREWLPSIPDLHDRLSEEVPARVADFGCGYGYSSVGIAGAYSNVVVDGFDLDRPSVERARDVATEHGVSNRVTFHCRNAGDPELEGRYDLVLALECLHDMGRPVEALTTMRRLAGENGTVLVVDERVGDRFTARGNDVEWMMYGWSIFHCLPVGIADGGGNGCGCGCGATGTVMRLPTVERYAREAGFARVEVLPIENYFFQVYRLHLK